MADNCADLSRELALLRSEVSRLRALSPGEVRGIVEDVLSPKVTEITYKLDAATTTASVASSKAGEALSKASSFDAVLRQMNAAIANVAATAGDAAKVANSASGDAKTANREAGFAGKKAQAVEAETLRVSREQKALEVKTARFATVAEEASGSAGTAIKKATKTEQDIANALRKQQLLEAQAARAFAKLDNVEDIAVTARRESKLNSSLINQVDGKATSAVTNSAKAARDALNASNEVGGLRGIVNGIGSKVDSFGRAIGALETRVGDAIFKAAEAVGISRQALGNAAKLAGRVAELFNIIGTVFTIIEQLAVLETLGARIDAVENQVLALGSDISRLLGILTGFKSRISNLEYKVPVIEDIASQAIVIGKNAATIATNALQSISSVRAIANQAQTTADGAVRNAKQANDNATTANNHAIEANGKAGEAIGIGEQAKRVGLDALGKAGVALTTALTAIALYQTFKGLRGLQGIPGVPGAKGEKGDKGERGLQGIPGITTVVTLPGIKGEKGDRGERGLPGSPGYNGKDGRDGIDVNPAETASLRALIVQQHSQTRASINATTTSVVGSAKAFIAAQFVALTTLVMAFANSTLVNTALNVLTFATTVHNAFMLSNNLTQTLGTVIDQILGVIIPKGLDGTPLSISTVLGKAVHEIIADTIGEANYHTITEDWAKANRIYQAGANVFNQLSNMTALITAGLEVIGGNVGKIGNALKKWGVVGEFAYGFMNPQPNLKGRFFNFLNSANDRLNTIVTMVAIPIGIGAAAVGINDSVSELTKSLNQVDPKDEHGQPIPDTVNGGFLKYQPGLAQPIPTVTTTQAAQEKADSQNIIEATLDDIFNAND
ncbi:alanine-zipper protein [Nostoc sp. TCL240-02]|uniref:alanine-zipper protein n=1 Tax=Nostoc sp. TCL240-02 TaxID=2572090 RepID=UPI00157F9678|nr:alanine-zipper protein [Nostoc sp. TCL240-02]QKQ76343.1 hypothetical protein FBB35_26400 [Nostoc sp. TCL240-02]